MPGSHRAAASPVCSRGSARLSAMEWGKQDVSWRSVNSTTHSWLDVLNQTMHSLTVWLMPHMNTLTKGSLARKSLTFWCFTLKCFFFRMRGNGTDDMIVLPCVGLLSFFARTDFRSDSSSTVVSALRPALPCVFGTGTSTGVLVVTLSRDGPGDGLTLAAAILLCPLAGRVQNDQMLNEFVKAEQVGMGGIDGGGTTTVIK